MRPAAFARAAASRLRGAASRLRAAASHLRAGAAALSLALSPAFLPAFLPVSLLAGLAAPTGVAAEEVLALEWADLLPVGGAEEAVTGAVAHEGAAGMSRPESAQAPAALRRDWDGRLVSLPGYVVPLDYDGAGTTAFILVPYVGACVHVPPPPANQLVMVTTERPWPVKGLFDPVIVTGMFGAAAASTAIAEVGYALSADRIIPYPR